MERSEKPTDSKIKELRAEGIISNIKHTSFWIKNAVIAMLLYVLLQEIFSKFENYKKFLLGILAAKQSEVNEKYMLLLETVSWFHFYRMLLLLMIGVTIFFFAALLQSKFHFSFRKLFVRRLRLKDHIFPSRKGQILLKGAVLFFIFTADIFIVFLSADALVRLLHESYFDLSHLELWILRVLKVILLYSIVIYSLLAILTSFLSRYVFTMRYAMTKEETNAE
jgi:flagellar biosynthesis protein FlhB